MAKLLKERSSCHRSSGHWLFNYAPKDVEVIRVYYYNKATWQVRFESGGRLYIYWLHVTSTRISYMACNNIQHSITVGNSSATEILCMKLVLTTFQPYFYSQYSLDECPATGVLVTKDSIAIDGIKPVKEMTVHFSEQTDHSKVEVRGEHGVFWIGYYPTMESYRDALVEGNKEDHPAFYYDLIVPYTKDRLYLRAVIEHYEFLTADVPIIVL